MRISDWSSDVCSSDLVDYGPLASRAQHDRVRSYLDVGAAEHAGHQPFDTGGTMPDRGFFMKPGLFATASGTMRVAREEIFGPLMALIPFADEAEDRKSTRLNSSQ